MRKKCLLLTEFEVRSESYGPSSVLIYGPSAECADHKSEEKNEIPKRTERTKRTRVVRYLSFHYLQFNPLTLRATSIQFLLTISHLNHAVRS